VRASEALTTTEFAVVQGTLAATGRAAYDDVLPATSWGDATVTNSERRISRVRSALTPPGETRADWRIASDFARRLSAKLRRSETHSLYERPEQIFNEHRQSKHLKHAAAQVRAGSGA
jgi:assimilatory nitrate reductase catalytic subunit